MFNKEAFSFQKVPVCNAWHLSKLSNTPPLGIPLRAKTPWWGTGKSIAAYPVCHIIIAKIGSFLPHPTTADFL